MKNISLPVILFIFFGCFIGFAQEFESEVSIIANPLYDQNSNNSYDFDSQPIYGSDWEWMHPTPQGNNLRFLKVFDANNWCALGYGGSFLRTSNAGATWFLNKNVGGLSSVAAGNNLFGGYFFDVNTGLACGENGVIVRTTDAGVTWSSVYSGTGFIYDIFFLNATVGYACGVATIGLLKTTDAGQTWTQIPTILPSSSYCIYAFDENLILLGSTTGNILRSTDGGTSWSTIYAAGTSLIWNINFVNADTGMVVGIDAPIAVTTDAGLTWTLRNTGIPATSDFFDIDIRQNTIYITGDSYDIYSTTDLGVTWNAIDYTDPSSSWVAGTFKSGFISDNEFVTVGSYGIVNKTIISPNSTIAFGKWLKAGITYDIWAESPTGRVILVGSAGISGVTFDQAMYSTDGGITWAIATNASSAVTFYSLSMVSSLVGYAACADHYVYKTTDGGASWIQVTQPIVSLSDLRTASFLDENNGYVFGEAGLGYKTTDGGTTWTALTTGITGTLYGSHFLDVNNGFICGATGTISKTTDGGTTFTALNSNNTSTIYTVYMVNANVGYASGSSGRVRKTIDGGATWTTVDVGNTSPALYDIQFRDENNGITVGSTGRTYSTTDGGATWLFESTGASSTLYAVHIEKSSTGFSSVYIGGSTGLVLKNSNLIIPVELTSFTASIQGSGVVLNWSTATEINNQGFEIQRKSLNSEFQKIGYVSGFGTTTESKSYSYSDFNLEAGQYIYRLKQIDFDGTFEYSNEIEVDINLTPNEYSLYQNYPNPFNPSTTIKFALPSTSNVKVEIFNMLGESVGILSDGIKEAGYHNVTWNAPNVASGIYFYSIQAKSLEGTKDFSSVKKMLMVK